MVYAYLQRRDGVKIFRIVECKYKARIGQIALGNGYRLVSVIGSSPVEDDVLLVLPEVDGLYIRKITGCINRAFPLS